MTLIPAGHLIDRFTAQQLRNLDGFLANMPDETKCECFIAAGLNGYQIPPCGHKATIPDRDSELKFSDVCYRRYLRGDWSAE